MTPSITTITLKLSIAIPTRVPNPENGTPKNRNLPAINTNKKNEKTEVKIANVEIAEIGLRELANNVLIAIGTKTKTVFLRFPACRAGRTISM
jgi:hypothetical protein